MHNKLHNNYSQKDIERYFSGKMSAKEMHDMEAYALEDPFLYDAMEGYENNLNAITHAHLKEIKEKIIASPKVVAIDKPKQWWKYAVAASVFAILAAGTWLLLSNNQSQEEVVQHSAFEKIVKPFEDSFPSDESIVVAGQDRDTFRVNEKTIAINTPSKRDALSTPLPNDKTFEAVQNEPSSPSQKMDVNEDRIVAYAPSAIAKAESSDSSMESFDDVVVVGYGQPKRHTVTGGVPALAKTNNNASDDVSSVLQGKAAGISTRTKAKNEATISIRGINTNTGEKPLFVIDGKIATQKELDKLKKEDIISTDVLKGDKATALYGSRGTNGVIVITTKKSVVGSTPVIGWKAYQKYIDKQLRTDTTKELQTVTVTFTPDAQGVPQNISVLGSIASDKKDKLINAVRSGSKWQPVTPQPVIFEVKINE